MTTLTLLAFLTTSLARNLLGRERFRDEAILLSVLFGETESLQPDEAGGDRQLLHNTDRTARRHIAGEWRTAVPLAYTNGLKD
jgi:hypothetical protein